jgi:hypothetical protein
VQEYVAFGPHVPRRTRTLTRTRKSPDLLPVRFFSAAEQKTEIRRHNWRDGWESAEYSRIEIGAGRGKLVEVQLDTG